MLKVMDHVETDTTVTAYFDVASGVYNIEFGTMTDLCHPIRIAVNMIMWIDDNGIIGELESIGPIKNQDSLNLLHAERVAGMPVIEYVSPCEEPVRVQNIPNGFILLLSEDVNIDTIFRHKNVSFLVSKGLLVGVRWDDKEGEGERRTHGDGTHGDGASVS